jgi:hypothetical protein
LGTARLVQAFGDETFANQRRQASTSRSAPSGSSATVIPSRQRLGKVLEDGRAKIDSVASSLTTASARDMIEAMIAERDPAVLARLARGVMRRKIPELEMACDGRFADSHAQMCRLHLDAWDHLTVQVAAVNQLVAEAAAPFAAVIARPVTIPGIGPRTASVIVEELADTKSLGGLAITAANSVR